MSSATIPFRDSVAPALPTGPTTVRISRAKAVELLQYLVKHGGTDILVFEDDSHQPDLMAARQYATNLREQLDTYLDQLVQIEQRAHRVFIRALLPSFV